MAASLLPSERAMILSQRGFARLKLNHTADAKADVDQALRIAPKSAFSLAASGLIEEELGHKPDAASLYSRALALTPISNSRAAVWNERSNRKPRLRLPRQRPKTPPSLRRKPGRPRSFAPAISRVWARRCWSLARNSDTSSWEPISLIPERRIARSNPGEVESACEGSLPSRGVPCSHGSQGTAMVFPTLGT